MRHEAPYIGPLAVGGLAFVTAVLAGFGTVVIGNDLGIVLADQSATGSDIWRPLFIFLCLPVATIVGACAVATVTGWRHPASIMTSGAVLFGTVVGVAAGRVVWQFIEIQNVSAT